MASLDLAVALAVSLDPVRLAHRAGMTPDPWQAGLLRSTARQIVMLCSRQSGKSTVAALLAVHTVLSEPGALVLLGAPGLRQAQEQYRKAVGLLDALGGLVPAIVQRSALTLELGTGSRVVCIPGDEKLVRGFSAVRLLVIDEAARVKDDLYGALRPMLAVSRGRIVLLSTPWGRRGAFFEEYTNGGPEWHRVTVTADQCPRIDPVWLAEERRRIPRHVFAAEYDCVFTDTVDQVFSSDDIERAERKGADIQPLFGVAA